MISRHSVNFSKVERYTDINTSVLTSGVSSEAFKSLFKLRQESLERILIALLAQCYV